MPTAQQAYHMLGNESLWQVAQRCHNVLDGAKVAHGICGGVAVCLHGYQRNTTDLDLLIRPEDAATVRSALETAGFVWDEAEKEFRSTSGIAVQFLRSGDRAGRDSEVRLPDPAAIGVLESMEGLPVLRLSRLIEAKLACGLGSLRRTHKDFADVVELIAVRNLDRSFARYLHRSLRPTFRELVRRVRG